MTRDEAKALLPIIKAYSDGKIIQYRKIGGEWIDLDKPYVDSMCADTENYRIKPSPTYRPFADAEECWEEMKKHYPFGWIRNKKSKAMENIRMLTFDTEVMPVSLIGAFEMYTFADGTPFGIKVEEDEQ